MDWCGLLRCFYQTLILTAPIHCRASIDSHSDGTHSLQSIHWLSFWRLPFTAEHPLMNKWCDATFLQIWWRNKLILIFNGPPDNFVLTHVHFWMNYSLKHRFFSSCFEFFLNSWVKLGGWIRSIANLSLCIKHSYDCAYENVEKVKIKASFYCVEVL